MSKVKVILRSRMYTTCRLIVIYARMQKFGMPMSKSKDILPDSNPFWKYNFDIFRSKVKVIQSSWIYATHRTMVLTCQTKYDYVKGEKSWGLNTKPCHKPYKLNLQVKGQCRIRIMNVLNTSSHGDRPMCQIWYANATANRSYKSDIKTWQRPINLTLKSKVNIEPGTWMYATHRLMVIHPCQIW